MQKLILAGAVVTIVASLAQAGVYGTWQTNGGGAWGTAANWSPSGAPSDTQTDASNPNEKDSARFDATAAAGIVTHTADIQLMNLDMQTAGWTFNLTDGKRLRPSYMNTGTTYSGGAGVNTLNTYGFNVADGTLLLNNGSNSASVGATRQATIGVVSAGATLGGAVAALRLPAKIPRDRPPELRMIDESAGWLGKQAIDMRTHRRVDRAAAFPFAEVNASISEHAWLPDAAFAADWVRGSNLEQPPAPPAAQQEPNPA